MDDNLGDNMHIYIHIHTYLYTHTHINSFPPPNKPGLEAEGPTSELSEVRRVNSRVLELLEVTGSVEIKVPDDCETLDR